MFNKSIIIILSFLIIIISISGCTNKNATNGTFGEKTVSLNTFKIDIIDAEHHDSVFYIDGNITNNNGFDALDVEMEATAYDENGTVIAVNKTPYIDPKNIPAQSVSYFYFEFNDPDNKIVKYEVKIISAQSKY